MYDKQKTYGFRLFLKIEKKEKIFRLCGFGSLQKSVYIYIYIQARVVKMNTRGTRVGLLMDDLAPTVKNLWGCAWESRMVFRRQVP